MCNNNNCNKGQLNGSQGEALKNIKLQADAAGRMMLPVLLQRAFFCTVSGCECVDTPGSSHPRGTFVQSADVRMWGCVCACMFVRAVYLDVRRLCVLGCMSTGINK